MITLDISADFEEVVDNVETVTLRRLNPDGQSYTDTTGVIALARVIRRLERDVGPIGSRASVVTCRFHLDINTAGLLPPKARDRIKRSDNVEYVVETCVIASFATRYQVETVRLAGVNT